VRRRTIHGYPERFYQDLEALCSSRRNERMENIMSVQMVVREYLNDSSTVQTRSPRTLTFNSDLKNGVTEFE